MQLNQLDQLLFYQLEHDLNINANYEVKKKELENEQKKRFADGETEKVKIYEQGSKEVLKIEEIENIFYEFSKDEDIKSVYFNDMFNLCKFCHKT